MGNDGSGGREMEDRREQAPARPEGAQVSAAASENPWLQHVTPSEDEPRLRRCARCSQDAEGELGRPMYGILVDELGSVPLVTVVREFARTRLLIRLRLCNACHAEAQSHALDMSEPTYYRRPGK
jgi:hypothetical protein